MKKKSNNSIAPFLCIMAIGGLFLLMFNNVDQSLPSKVQLTTNQENTPNSLSVVGSQGQRIMFEEDGVWLTDANGDRRRIANKPEDMAVNDSIEEKIRDKLLQVAAKKKKNIAPGVLIVLDEGIVEIPKDSVVTWQGKSKLTCIHADGTVSSYYADGRVIPQENSTRLGKDR